MKNYWKLKRNIRCNVETLKSKTLNSNIYWVSKRNPIFSEEDKQKNNSSIVRIKSKFKYLLLENKYVPHLNHESAYVHQKHQKSPINTENYNRINTRLNIQTL